MLVRNIAGIDGFSAKIGRQYVVFGNQRLFGHFDWANTGYSHDGIMLSYATAAFDTKLGWFRNSETDLGQASPGGSLTPNLLTCNPEANSSATCNPALAQHATDAGSDVDLVVFYSQLRSIPRMIVEPYYVLYSNRLPERANPGQYLPKSASQLRHMVGLRIEFRDGNWDFTHEAAYQFGRSADGFDFDNRRNLRINAWASGRGSATHGTPIIGSPGSPSDSTTPPETATATVSPRRKPGTQLRRQCQHIREFFPDQFSARRLHAQRRLAQ
jgi:hypothetical protein